MLCTSCHFDLGASVSKFCPNCGAPCVAQETQEAIPAQITDIPGVAAAPRARQKQPWLALIIGGASVSLALLGLVWVTLQDPPARALPAVVVPNARLPPPAPVTRSPEPPPPEPSLPPEPLPVAPPVAPPDPPPQTKAAPPPDTLPSTPAQPDWISEMRQALDQCQSMFCRERVRWKYCNQRWNSVPECAVGQEDQDHAP
jgi:hypothetical protein